MHHASNIGNTSNFILILYDLYRIGYLKNLYYIEVIFWYQLILNTLVLNL